jgi:hypothetical protein
MPFADFVDDRPFEVSRLDHFEELIFMGCS